MMAETLVRGLSPLELAERLRDSDDFATKTLANHLIGDYSIGDELQAEVESLERQLEASQDRALSLEEQREDLIGLLTDCLDAVSDDDLKCQIKAALAK